MKRLLCIGALVSMFVMAVCGCSATGSSTPDSGIASDPGPDLGRDLGTLLDPGVVHDSGPDVGLVDVSVLAPDNAAEMPDPGSGSDPFGMADDGASSDPGGSQDPGYWDEWEPPPDTNVPNPDANDSEAGPPATGLDCKSCKGASDCGYPFSCVLLAGGKFCLKSCTALTDCPGGYICYQVSSSGKACVPPNVACVECAYAGCTGADAGKVCDLDNGMCVAAKATCDICSFDWECGTGNRCYKSASSAASGVCVAECSTTSCPVGFACNADSRGVELCMPTNSTVCQPCPSAKPIPATDGSGNCWQCGRDLDCTDPTAPSCDASRHTCGSQCQTAGLDCSSSPTTPVCCVMGGAAQCCQCSQDQDCKDPTAPSCDASRHTCASQCMAAGVDCSTNADYPICCVMGGMPQCCQCSQDQDCKATTLPSCDASSHICETQCQAAGVDCLTNADYHACCVTGDAPQCCECAGDLDCTDFTKPRCDTSTNTCVPAGG